MQRFEMEALLRPFAGNVVDFSTIYVVVNGENCTVSETTGQEFPMYHIRDLRGVVVENPVVQKVVIGTPPEPEGKPEGKPSSE